MHTLIESTDSVKNITWYFDFVTNEHMVMTAMDHKKKDTLGHAYSWNIYLVDSICVLGLGDIFCSRFFTTDTMGPKIIAYSALTSFSSVNYRLIKIIYKKRPDIILQPNLKEQLIGNWEVKESSSIFHHEISTLRFTEDQILLNENSYRPLGAKWKSQWYLDKFGKVIVTDLDNGLRSIQLIELNEKLVIETGHDTYVLERKL